MAPEFGTRRFRVAEVSGMFAEYSGNVLILKHEGDSSKSTTNIVWEELLL